VRGDKTFLIWIERGEMSYEMKEEREEEW
jgi:hypothetical protein